VCTKPPGRTPGHTPSPCGWPTGYPRGFVRSANVSPTPGERQREAVDDAVSALWTIRGVAVDDTLVQLWKPPRVAYRNPGDLREACPLDVEERKLQAFDHFSG
jgi:hypothetical protein